MSKTKLKYKRILLKLSGEVLGGATGQRIDFPYLERLCSEIAEVRKLGVEIVIVVGGGNFWRYRDTKDSGLDRVHSDYMGMLATVMNSMAMANQLNRLGVKARAMSAIKMPQVLETYHRDVALDEIDEEIIICAGGTASPFFTTDSAAALRALELQCDAILKATKVDYVYDRDPVKHKKARSFKQLSYDEVLRRELEVMDLAAISLCKGLKMPIVVFNLKKKGNIAKAVGGQAIGTTIN